MRYAVEDSRKEELDLGIAANLNQCIKIAKWSYSNFFPLEMMQVLTRSLERLSLTIS
jgi:hypothetical protein